MPRYHLLSNEALAWLKYPRLSIKKDIWDEVDELSQQLYREVEYAGHEGTPDHPESTLAKAFEAFFEAIGQGGLARQSERKSLADDAVEVDCIPRIRAMTQAPPYSGQFPTDEVPLPSNHPVLHASVTLYLMYKKYSHKLG